MTIETTPSKLMHRWIFWSGLAVLLPVLYWGYYWVVTPHVNPHPTKKVVVQGAFPYDQGWELQAGMDFYAANSLCKRTSRIFFVIPVADVAREQRISIPVTREGENRYSFTYFEDYFLPGLCEWSRGFTYYRIFQNGRELQGGAILGLNRRYNQINYDCHFIEIPTPGMGKGTKEKSIVCGDYRDKSKSFDPQRTDNEVNFIWKGEEK